MQELEQIAEVAEHEFNAIITDVRTEDELRGYEKPYSATALAYEDSEASIESLVEAVSTDGFKLSRKFYKLKAQYHGVSALPYANKYDSIGTEPTIPFAQAVEICRDVFYRLKSSYGEVFDAMLTNGQIDVYPKQGKRGGAFMSSQTGHPTHVFLNHTDTFKSLETLAHEMGHAIHSERSKTQSPLYDGHSVVTAETASTLFENLVFDAVLEQVPEEKKVILIHDRIARDIATIQRQIAFFNTELEIHETIDGEGGMSKEELRACMEKHLKRYLGPAVIVTQQDGYSFAYIPHLRYGFYVYTYSIGLLMSTIMSNRYKADNGYIDEIDHFLSTGSSASVADIFKSINIDTADPQCFADALKTQAADINTFSKYVRASKQ
jgi:oligoendopeptidase F